MAWIDKRLQWVALGLTMSASGCLTPEPDYAEVSGDLGHGVFRWGCTSDTTTTCATGSFPSHIAVGAHFSLGFVVSEQLPDEVEVEQIVAASPTHLEGSDSFEVKAAGDVTVIAMGRDYTIDMVTLSLRPIDEIALDVSVNGDSVDDCTDDCPNDTASDHVITVGGSATIDAEARWSGVSLGGGLEYEWSAEGEAIGVQGGGRSAHVSGLEVGEAWVHVRVGDYTESVRVQVVEAPEPEPEPDPGSTGIDGLAPTPADEDSGSGDGSGSDTGGTSGSDSGDTDGGESSTGGQ